MLNWFDDNKLRTKSKFHLGSAERVPGFLSHILLERSLSFLSSKSMPNPIERGSQIALRYTAIVLQATPPLQNKKLKRTLQN